MVGWLGDAYPWVKAGHVAVVMFWMAGLFALPRYLAYQSVTAPGSAEEALWTERAGRLRRVILTPSLVLSWLLGLALALSYGFAGAGWLHAKLGVVVALSGYHGWASATAKRMGRGERPYTDRTLRLMNEVPALAIIVIAVLVVVKPF